MDAVEPKKSGRSQRSLAHANLDAGDGCFDVIADARMLQGEDGTQSAVNLPVDHNPEAAEPKTSV